MLVTAQGRLAWGVAVIAAATLAGCETAEQRALGAERSASVGQALDQIVEAHCARAERCEQLGPGRRFLTREVCRVTVRDEEEREIHAEECAAGVSSGMLSECLERVEEEGCDDTRGTLARLKACRTSQICRRDR